MSQSNQATSQGLISVVCVQLPSIGIQQPLCLLAPTCMGIGISVMVNADISNEVVTFSSGAGSGGDEFMKFREVLFFLFFDACWMFALAYYIRQIKPGEYMWVRNLIKSTYSTDRNR